MSTLGQLKTSVDAWLSRDDVAVSGTDFTEIILLFESEIARDVRAVVQETSASIVITGREADLPADYLEMRNPFIDDNIRKFEFKTPQALRESSEWITGRVGGAYTLEGNAVTGRTKIVVASPASVTNPLTVNINYWARFPAFVNDADTNWLLVNHFDIYLYAALRASAEYLQEDTLEDRYGAKYERAVDKQTKHENRKRYGAVPKQSYGNPRGVV